MRMSRVAAAESRARIVEEAASLLRARGVAGASVAEVMQAAGMTHGGFYKHFASKDALLAEATAAMFAQVAVRFDRRQAKKGGGAAIAAYVADYLSAAHIAHPEQGCPLAAFGADAGRHPEALSQPFAEGVEALVERVSRAGASRQEAIHKLVTLVGAVVAARAVGAGSLRQEILAAARGVCDDDAS
ncbi:MAG TPA: helix-turn-helix domain-containing protein [Roseiarcus sp.]|nr:helix-turn-helix domain-containing protein [Roseiarcus sp.]